MKCVSHQQASQLLHNKFIVVLGDSSEYNLKFEKQSSFKMFVQF